MTYFRLFVVIFLTVVCLQACSNEGTDNPLDPDQPISITLWHYYSGNTKISFDALVDEFNETVGLEKGILVDAQSQGDIVRLETAVFDAANNTIGAQRLPDIFASYADNAYRVGKIVPLVDLETYFSPEELAEYRDDFLEIGRVGIEQKLTILPVAKATENLFVNKTVWDAFSAETHTPIEALQTWEGIVKVSEAYYQWSGGKAFLGVDSVANFMLSAALQKDAGIVSYRFGKAELKLDKYALSSIWTTYYIPMMKGHFAKEGRFSSDDAKLGVIAAYTGSTASASYFPNEVTLNATEIVPIDSVVLPYPTFDGGAKVVSQQGAGMVIVESDYEHELAAAEFLKWFTDVKQNRTFAAATAYFPVKTEALKEAQMLQAVREEQSSTSSALNGSISTTVDMLKSYYLYGYPAFENSYELRELLDKHLYAWVQADKKKLAGLEGAAYDAQLSALLSPDNFDNWYNTLLEDIRVTTTVPTVGDIHE